MRNVIFSIIIFSVFSCGENKNVVLHGVEVKNNSEEKLTEGKVLIGDFKMVSDVFFPAQERTETSMDHSFVISEKSPIFLSINFKFKGKEISDKIDISSKLKPFVGKRIIIKFEISPERNPIIINLEIKKSEF